MLGRGGVEGGLLVVASDWCWSISCFSRRPHKKGRRQEGLCWPSRKTPRSATLPKPPPASAPAPPLLLPCAKTYIRAGAGVPRPAHGFTSGLFHSSLHGSGGRARHVTTLVATCCRGGKNYINAYIALLKNLRQDCPCRQSCS